MPCVVSEDRRALSAQKLAFSLLLTSPQGEQARSVGTAPQGGGHGAGGAGMTLLGKLVLFHLFPRVWLGTLVPLANSYFQFLQGERPEGHPTNP